MNIESVQDSNKVYGLPFSNLIGLASNQFMSEFTFDGKVWNMVKLKLNYMHSSRNIGACILIKFKVYLPKYLNDFNVETLLRRRIYIFI